MATSRDEILACACDLFLEEGVDGFTMRELARRVGVTAPALYRHFESREALLADVVGEAYRLLRDHLSRALEGEDAGERFRLAGRAYLDFATDHPGYYHALYAGRRAIASGCVAEEVRAQGCAVGQFWQDRVRECMDAGLLRENDPTAVSLTLWGHAHGLISLHLLGMLEMDDETFGALYDASNLRLLQGLAPEGTAPTAD